MRKYYLFIALIAFVFIANYLVFAFQEPTTPPPPDPNSINVPKPINVSDVAQIKNGDFTAQNLWSTHLSGEGRPRVGVLDAGGECRVGALRVSRSDRSVTWDGATAACPKSWWVCTAAERGTSDCRDRDVNGKVKFADNASGGLSAYMCEISGQDNYHDTVSMEAWVSDAATGTGGKRHEGRYITADTGAGGDEQICSQLPVWCCSYR